MITNIWLTIRGLIGVTWFVVTHPVLVWKLVSIVWKGQVGKWER